MDSSIEKIVAPEYVVEAAEDPEGDYRNFVTYGSHPPKWLFDPSVTSSKGAVGGALVQSSPEAYRWNMIRRNVASQGEITKEQYVMLEKEVSKYDGGYEWTFNKGTELWFEACKKWVEDMRKNI